MYLVIERHTMDDLPIGLFETRAEAVKFAAEFTEPQSEKTVDRLGFDCTTPCNISIVRFRGSRPQSMSCVRSYDDEPATA